MGADNLRSFHRWENWRGIAAMVPIAVVDRLGPSLYAAGGTAGPGAGALPHPGDGGAVAGRPQAAGLGLPARAEIAAVVDRAARGPAAVAKPPLKMSQNTARLGTRRVVETINRPCLSLRCAGIGAVSAVKEAKGKRSLSTPAVSRAGARRAPERVSKVRPDAEETLRLVLASIDDMKAEDTVTIDLTGKSSIADPMVVTSGTFQPAGRRDRGSRARRPAQSRAEERAGRGHAALRLGADRRR